MWSSLCDLIPIEPTCKREDIIIPKEYISKLELEDGKNKEKLDKK